MSSMIGLLIPTWNPSEKFITTLKSIAPQVDKVLIVDNNSDKSSKELIQKIEKQSSDKLTVKYLDQNTGTAHAYNLGFPILFNMGCDQVLISDQDSTYDKNYISQIQKMKKKHGDIIYGANVVDKNSGESKKYEIFKRFWFYRTRNFQKGILFCSMLISSGTVISKSIFEKVGPFNEKLFIACVDTEYCLRANLNSVKCAAVEGAKIYHEQGKAKKVTPFLTSKQYSPFRLYHIGKSRMICMKKYWTQLGFVGWLKLGILHHIVVITFIEHQKLAKIKKLMLGIVHGIIK